MEIRACPQCNKSIKYASKYELARGKKNKTYCRPCTNTRLRKRNKQRTKISGNNKSSIVSLLKQKITYRKIKETLKIDVTDAVISRIAKENNLQRFTPKKLSLVGSNKAKCSKCNLVKLIDQFKKNRSYKTRTGIKVGFFSYCRECCSKQERERINKNPLRHFKEKVKNLKSRAIKNKILFDITGEDLLSIFNKQNGLCFYTDEKMILKKDGKGVKRLSVSVDRIVPKLGYTQGNVVLCAYIVNRAKSDLTLEELKKWIPQWYERLKCQKEK